jgi:hypothetical protein
MIREVESQQRFTRVNESSFMFGLSNKTDVVPTSTVRCWSRSGDLDACSFPAPEASLPYRHILEHVAYANPGLYVEVLWLWLKICFRMVTKGDGGAYMLCPSSASDLLSRVKVLINGSLTSCLAGRRL